MAPLPGTDFMFLNVREPPFDDVRVRRAINFATDRARMVALAGGSEAAQPSCQLVPPSIPGRAPVLPVHRATFAGGNVGQARPRAGEAADRRVRHARDARARVDGHQQGPLRPLLRAAPARARLRGVDEGRRGRLGLLRRGRQAAEPRPDRDGRLDRGLPDPGDVLRPDFSCAGLAAPGQPQPLAGLLAALDRQAAAARGQGGPRRRGRRGPRRHGG